MTLCNDKSIEDIPELRKDLIIWPLIKVNADGSLFLLLVFAATSRALLEGNLGLEKILGASSKFDTWGDNGQALGASSGERGLVPKSPWRRAI